MSERQNPVDPMPFVKRIIDVAKVHADAANQHVIEGNKFEFDVCDLLLKGAGGAIFFYLAILNLPGNHRLLQNEVLIFFGLSLIVGIYHKLHWSRISLNRANREFKVHAQIITDLFARVSDPRRNAEEIIKFWKEISDEEGRYYNEFISGKRSNPKEFKYFVPPQARFPFPVIIQAILIFCGAISIFGNINSLLTILFNYICGCVR